MKATIICMDENPVDVGRPIVAAAGYEPAFGIESAAECRLKGGSRQDCPPHRASAVKTLARCS